MTESAIFYSGPEELRGQWEAMAQESNQWINYGWNGLNRMAQQGIIPGDIESRDAIAYAASHVSDDNVREMLNAAIYKQFHQHFVGKNPEQVSNNLKCRYVADIVRLVNAPLIGEHIRHVTWDKPELKSHTALMDDAADKAVAQVMAAEIDSERGLAPLLKTILSRRTYDVLRQVFSPTHSPANKHDEETPVGFVERLKESSLPIAGDKAVFEQVAARDMMNHFLQKVRYLKPQHREVIEGILQADMGATYKEVAEQIGMQQMTFNSNLTRAKKELVNQYPKMMNEIAMEIGAPGMFDHLVDSPENEGKGRGGPKNRKTVKTRG